MLTYSVEQDIAGLGHTAADYEDLGVHDAGHHGAGTAQHRTDKVDDLQREHITLFGMIEDILCCDLGKVTQRGWPVAEGEHLLSPANDPRCGCILLQVALLAAAAGHAYEKGAAKDFDIMQGCTKDECSYFVAGMDLDIFIPWAENCKAEKLAQCTGEERALAESFCENLPGEDYDKLSHFLDQYWFNAPLIRTAENQVKGGGKTYVYYFRVESSIPMMKSGHAIELSELFNHAEETLVTGREFDKTFSKTMRKMWVQFAKCGNPSLPADVSPDGKAREWPLYDLEDKYVMVFDEFNIRAEKESAMNIVDWEKTYFLTKYYVR